jgi:hypothetical protein
MNTYEVHVTRVGYGSRLAKIQAKTLQEAKDKALAEAGNFLYSEHTSEYEIESATRIEE